MCFAILAGTSAIVSYQIPAKLLFEYNPPYWLLAILGVCAAITFYVVVDGPVGAMLPHAMDGITDPNFNSEKEKAKHPEKRMFVYSVAVAAGFLLIVTGTISIWSAEILAAVIVDAPDANEYSEKIGGQADKQTAILSDLQKQLNVHREQYKNERVNKNEQKEKAVNMAKMNPLYKKWGSTPDSALMVVNVYVANGRIKRSSYRTMRTYWEGIKNAEAKFDAEIKALDESNERTEKALLSSIENTSEGTVIQSLTKIAEEEITSAKEKTNIWSWFFILIDILSFFGALIFTYLFAKGQHLYGKIETSEQFTIAAVFNNFRSELLNYPLSLVHRHVWNLQLIGGGDVHADVHENEQNEHENEHEAGHKEPKRKRGTKKERTRRQEINIALKMKNAGATQREISEYLGVSLGKVNKLLKSA